LGGSDDEAVGVNAEGYREILGIDVTTAEDGAGRLTFLRSLTARGLSGVRLVTSDAHAGLLAAIGATLPGASWQRCRTHYATNLMAVTPKSSWPWVAPNVSRVGVFRLARPTHRPQGRPPVTRCRAGS
jgi:transposase-like protein